METVREGVHGYCGVMANFHPDLYTRLLKGNLYSREASLLQDFLGLAATIEGQTYPCCAKYYLDRFEGVTMEWDARSADVRKLTAYQRSCVNQLAEVTNAIRTE